MFTYELWILCKSVIFRIISDINHIQWSFVVKKNKTSYFSPKYYNVEKELRKFLNSILLSFVNELL